MAAKGELKRRTRRKPPVAKPPLVEGKPAELKPEGAAPGTISVTVGSGPDTITQAVRPGEYINFTTTECGTKVHHSRRVDPWFDSETGEKE